MRISLYVLARNEAANIIDCLAPLAQLFDDIVVVDDASTDGTAELLAANLGITPLRMDSAACGSKAALRNLAISRTRHPWVLKLDADERLSRAQAERLLALPEPADCAGYFCAWRTFTADSVIEDYKLSLARRDCLESGLVHENLQQHLRRRRLHAHWLPDVELLHYPDPAMAPGKVIERRGKLLAAMKREPAWYRYHWFLGYMDYLAGDHAASRQHLGTVCGTRSHEFPVECLNAHMVLADLQARHDEHEAVLATLRDAREFHAQVRDDFEVRVNFRIGPWLQQALQDAATGNLDAVRAYSFAR